jgi:hypothetical protein
MTLEKIACYVFLAATCIGLPSMLAAIACSFIRAVPKMVGLILSIVTHIFGFVMLASSVQPRPAPVGHRPSTAHQWDLLTRLG